MFATNVVVMLFLPNLFSVSTTIVNIVESPGCIMVLAIINCVQVQSGVISDICRSSFPIFLMGKPLEIMVLFSTIQDL